ncbi:uncharacterized protein LOC132194433 isoform X2 [Neocloeon triangulifer]|uniref:uncharacterized protein LOC132194433 isoform X2 n=1 Tax=Neocloeon triangulifer TaxID=2078957 RepID=UPI00286F1273|nr:uncharacterized protein LOC132194433 isoform X2 [Neocloeon triangulifer]
METATSKRYFDTDPLGRGYEAHIDVGTQADIRPPRPDVNASYSDDEYSSNRNRSVSGLWDSGRRYLSRVTSTRATGPQHYSRQDFMEQYCVTPHQLKALDKIANAVNNHQGGGLFGCLSSNQQGSPCSKSSLLSLCVGRQSNGAEEMAQYWPQKPPRSSHLPPAPPPPANPAGRGGRGRYQWVPEQAEEAYHSLERPRPIPIAGFPTQDFNKGGEGSGGQGRLIGQGNMKITEEQIRQAQARMRGFNHTEPNTPLSSRRGHALDIDDGRRGSKHVSFMEHRSGLVRSQTTSSFEEAHLGAAARWRMAAARSQERLLDGPMIKPKKANYCFTHEEESPAKKTVIMEKLKRAAMKTQATQTELPLPAVVQKPPREKRHHHHQHHQHGYLSLSPRSMHKSTQAQRTRIMKSYSASCGGSTAAQSQASDISCISGSTSGWEHMQDSADDDDHEEQPFKDRPFMQRSQSAQPSTRHKCQDKRDLSPRYKEIFIDFEPNPNKVSPQPSPKSKRPLHKTLSEGEILLERRRIQHSDYIDRQCESSATVEDAELYGRHFDPTSPPCSPQMPLAKKSSEGTDGTNGSMFSSSSLLDEEEFHENILMREGLFGKRRLSLDGRSVGRSEDSEFSDDRGADEVERRPQSQPATVITTSGLLLLPDTSKQTGGSSCDSLSVSGYTGSQQNTWRESQATVIGINNSDLENMGSTSEVSSGSNQKRGILIVSQQQKPLEAEFTEEDESVKPPTERRKSASPQPPKPVSSPFSNKASPYQSPSLLRPSPACMDVSETSEDYVTATDNSGATDSSSRRLGPDGQHEPSGTSSSNLGEGGSSFESASSMHSKDEVPLEASEPMGGDSTPTPRPDLIECSAKVPAESASLSSPSAESSSSQGSYSLQGSSAADADQAHSSPHLAEKSKAKVPFDVSTVEQKPTIQQPTTAQWGDEERTKAKRGFKLDLPSTPSPSKNETAIPVTKPPRRKHRHPVEPAEVTTPGMVRSPAMHQGFRAEDWVVSRSSPSTSIPPTISNIPPSERISPQTATMAVSPGSRRLQAMRRNSSSSSSSDEGNVRRTPSPSGRSPTNCKTLPRASPRRRPARSPTASLQRPIRRKSVSDETKGISTSQTALPAVTYTASSVRRKSAPKICSPVKGPDGKIVPPEKLLSPHPHHKFHSLGRKSGSNKTSPVHVVKTAVSAESLRSVSPGSDSVFYDPQLSGSPSTAIGTDTSPQATQSEAAPANGDAFIVKPPEGFGDSPEGPKKPGGRLYKKLEKRRFKSEEREKGSCNHQHKEGTGTHPRRHQHRACKHATARAKSEERRGEKGDNTKVASSRSANSSLELLRASGSSPNMQPENPDEIGVIYGSYRTAFWLYISPRDEKLVWKKPLPATPSGSPPTSPDGSTCSERDFRRRYQAVTHRMVHRRASAEMFERLAARTFETEQTVTVRKGDGEFGFRIHGSRPVVVSAIEPSTPAESSGLEVGDIVISVNGVNVLDASHSEVVKIAHAAGRVRMILGSEVLQLEVARTRHLISPDESDSPEIVVGVERCGHLMKKTPTAGQWVHRWFVLRYDGCLYYYKTPSLESRPLGAILVSQFTVSAPDPAILPEGANDPRWLIRLLKDGILAMTLSADSQAERDQWLSSLYTAATTPIKWEDRLVNRGTLGLNPSDIINPDCFGFLNKLGRRWRNWNRLYCVLKDACLFLFPTPDSPRASGLLCLHGYRVQTASAGGKRFAFDLLAPESKQKHFYFHTDTELDKKRWMAALEYSIDRWLKIA